MRAAAVAAMEARDSQASVERVAIFPTNVALVPITMPSTGIDVDMTAASCQPRRKAKV